MTEKISKSSVFRRLSQIRHPEIQDSNLVGLGMIPDAQVDGAHVLITLALPYAEAPIRPTLIDLVRNAVNEMADGLEVEIDVKEMEPAEREAFLAQAKKSPVSGGSGGTADRMVAVMSGKGGVGKSSVAALLATSLRRRGLAVGILDADITGPSIPKMFGITNPSMAGPQGPMPVESRTGIKIVSINLLLPAEDQPVVWRGPLISKAIEEFWREFAWGALDYLVVDLPPGTSDAALTVTQSLPLSSVMLVTSPQDLAGMVVRKAAHMVKHLGVPLLGLVENMSHTICPTCGTKIGLFGDSRAADTARLVGTDLLGQLPLDTRLAVLCDRGEIEDYRCDAFDAVAERVIQLVPERKLETPESAGQMDV
jgi:Mrp family chromosome partitioning ATPase